MTPRPRSNSGSRERVPPLAERLAAWRAWERTDEGRMMLDRENERRAKREAQSERARAKAKGAK